jgi:peptide deformylase
VTEFDGVTQDLVLHLVDLMRAYEGIGLAAPQIGVPQRVVVADVGHGLVAIVNPVIEDGKGSDRKVEGCLSLPEIHVEIERSQQVVISGRTATGEDHTWECSGLMARVLQHEIDHLNGILIVDHAPAAERLLLNRRIKKLQHRQRRADTLPHRGGTALAARGEM